MIGEFGLLGVPSSAAAHGPGQEKAPAALRRARLPERLSAAGVRLVDYGDLPVVRWQPNRHQRRPHNLQAVLGVLRETTRRVGAILADGRIPLVLGGECSVTIAVVAAFGDRGSEPALLYMDGGVDLFTPATNPTGILDSMGVAHLLDEPGSAPELAGLGPARPLLSDDRLLLFGYTDYPGAEQEVLVRRDLARLPVEQIRGRPEQAAEEALARVSASANRFLLHLDVDVVDFIDLPIARCSLAQRGPDLRRGDDLPGGLRPARGLGRPGHHRVQSRSRRRGWLDRRCARARLGRRTRQLTHPADPTSYHRAIAGHASAAGVLSGNDRP
jgi:arginase